MNKARRKELEGIIGVLEDLMGKLSSIKDEEQEYIDSMPESLQQGERAQAAEQAVSDLEEVDGHLSDAIASIEEAING